MQFEEKDDEYVMVCEPFVKFNQIGSTQSQIKDQENRIYIMTFKRIYVFKDQMRTRCYEIADVGAILQSSQN